MTTADQDAWIEIARAVRSQLCKAVDLMPAMKPDELKTLAETLQAALWLEKCAATYDDEVEQMRRRFSYSDS